MQATKKRQYKADEKRGIFSRARKKSAAVGAMTHLVAVDARWIKIFESLETQKKLKRLTANRQAFASGGTPMAAERSSERTAVAWAHCIVWSATNDGGGGGRRRRRTYERALRAEKNCVRANAACFSLTRCRSPPPPPPLVVVSLIVVCFCSFARADLSCRQWRRLQHYHASRAIIDGYLQWPKIGAEESRCKKS